MAVVTTYPFTTSANYDFDAAKIVVTGGLAKKVARVFADEQLYMDFSLDENPIRGTGTLTGTLSGAVLTGNELDCTGGGITTLSVPADNFASITQTGTIRFNYTPNFSGFPAASLGIFTSTVVSINNKIELIHTNSGKIIFTLSSSVGASIIASLGNITWAPIAGVSYDFEINFDITNGASRIFIDGIQLGATDTGTGTRGAQSDAMLFGRSFAVSASDFFVDNIQFFDTVQHTADFTPETSFSTYDINGDSISPVSANNIDTVGLISMSEVVVKPTNTDVKYALTIDGADKYHDGVNWVNSSGSAQVNTIAEINTNALSLDLSAQVILLIKTYLFTTFGHDTPSVDSITVNHVFAPEPITVNRCTVRAELIDASDSPIVGAKIKFIPNAFFYEEIYVFEEVEVTTDSEGKASVSIVETASKSATMNIRIEYQDGTVKLFKNKIIPNQDNEALSNIILT